MNCGTLGKLNFRGPNFFFFFFNLVVSGENKYLKQYRGEYYKIVFTSMR